MILSFWASDTFADRVSSKQHITPNPDLLPFERSQIEPQHDPHSRAISPQPSRLRRAAVACCAHDHLYFFSEPSLSRRALIIPPACSGVCKNMGFSGRFVGVL